MPCPGPATPSGKPPGLASCAFARHYSRNRVCFPLLQVLRCFTSLGVALGGLSLFIRRRPPSRAAGLPHSETHGSRPADGSPWNIAVCRVLLRLMTPRHPSCARIRLARNFLASRLRCNSLQFQSSSFQRSKKWCRTCWWRQSDSNRRLPACKAGALPAELCPRNNEQVKVNSE